MRDSYPYALMSNEPYSFTFIGRSGCGKGTQAELLKKLLEKRSGPNSVFYISTGAQLRGLLDHPELFTARLLQNKILGPGEKSPDALAIWAFTKELVHGATEYNHIIADGTPRTAIEAEVWDEMLDFLDRKNTFHIWLNASAEWVSDRMIARERSDDNPENIKRRMAYYEKRVVPAIEFYKKDQQHKLLEINGEQEIEKVHQDIIKAIGL